MNSIESYRRESGKSFSDIARMSGISRATVWKHCNDVVEPDTKSLKKYLAAGIPVASFLDGALASSGCLRDEPCPAA